MRYFLSTSAALPVHVGGFAFEFEPVALRGGSWLGVLAVEDDSAASALASSGIGSVSEIDLAKYDGLKKKTMGAQNALNGQPNRQEAQTFPQTAAPATSPTDHRSDDVGSVSELKTTTLTPPREFLLEEPSLKKKGRPGRPSVDAE